MICTWIRYRFFLKEAGALTFIKFIKEEITNPVKERTETLTKKNKRSRQEQRTGTQAQPAETRRNSKAKV
jgi:hypothetical protein